MLIEQKKLKAILKERGISTYKLSGECDIHSPDMYNCVNGKVYIYPKWRKAIAEYLGLPEEDIFEDEVSKTTKVERLLGLNRELRELYEEGILDAGNCGNASVQMRGEAFDELTEGRRVEARDHSEEYVEYFVEIEGVRFFHLEERKES